MKDVGGKTIHVNNLQLFQYVNQFVFLVQRCGTIDLIRDVFLYYHFEEICNKRKFVPIRFSSIHPIT